MSAWFRCGERIFLKSRFCFRSGQAGASNGGKKLSNGLAPPRQLAKTYSADNTAASVSLYAESCIVPVHPGVFTWKQAACFEVGREGTEFQLKNICLGARSRCFGCLDPIPH